MSEIQTDHARGCQGREYTCTCGYDDQREWQPISEHKPLHSMQQVLCGHSEKKWIRFGFYETVLKRWYYSGTSERSQWAQVEGDAPTHFQPLPSPPKPLPTPSIQVAE